MNVRPLIAILLGAACGAAAGEETVVLPEFPVPDVAAAAFEVDEPRSDLPAPAPNLAAELLAIPGVSGEARAADAVEPNFRGLDFDRIATTIDGLPLPNASPERTTSPIVILGPAAVASVAVAKALPSVTLGPVATGGTITLGTAPAAGAGRGSRGCVTMGYDGGRGGFTTEGLCSLDLGGLTACVTAFADDLGDYRAADREQVAARLEDTGASFALGWNDGGEDAHLTYLERRLDREETVSLPLDGKNSESQVLTLNERWSVSSGPLESIACRLGVEATDPYMTNEDRIGSAPIDAKGRTQSAGAGVETVWRTGEDARLALGADWARQTLLEVRTTPVEQDYIWPNIDYDDAGVFAEWNGALGSGWRLRAGARLDSVHSDARDAARPALGLPILDQYVIYNGPTATAVARGDLGGAANALLQSGDGRPETLFVGSGVSVQPAQATERYRAFLNALGGDGHGNNAYEIGNPALHSETKGTIEAGVDWRRPWADAEAVVYFYGIDDFILRTPVGKTGPPPTPLVVFGYRNADAEFAGGEFASTLKPSRGLTFPISLAVSEGRNRTDGRGIAEIPPWEATADARHSSTVGLRPWSAEVGVRVAGEKDNPAPEENPLFGHAGGFAVWHLRGEVGLEPRLRFRAGLENLFNRRYTEYLTPPVAPVAPASGDLVPGERVPEPGRYLWMSVTLDL